ncbi:embryogenesis-associated protein EMB8-like isoform X2 [Impatiens glandulifera]|uniref:embryogenesis-associated protein EMB8-like isoform X2 n=1 Tax=Impatiens glandulifera TaxID=253017 RepID=UPI001FB14EBF|nr:embryogenesis-associated protein EMB8-like isoform X2 [Impatiens glandulifera]
MDCSSEQLSESPECAYKLLFKAISMIPKSHFACFLIFFFLYFLYNFLEFHFLEDAFTAFRGSPISLTYNPASEIYQDVVSKCRILHGRYLATPWMSSPHIQTTLLNFFGRPPAVTYTRQLYRATDGGTIALDWLLYSDVLGDGRLKDSSISKDDTTPIVIIIPGLTSDSTAPYLKHLAWGTAKCGWNVVVSNHRGLGGISVTSDCFYNAGWTEDIREVIHYLHREHPRAPLLIIGTSIGANILVKFLGEDGENIPIGGAVAICSPWDLLIGDRFISRRLVQKLYDRALAIGLQGYAKMHEPQYTRLANWEGIEKSRSIRDFDNYATCHVGKFETVDTYYRHCSSSSFVAKVAVPLLCISSLDDPVCTKEAIPWDECRLNKNIVLATTKHGGHLAFFEGPTASGLWWVRATCEYLSVLLSSSHMHIQKKTMSCVPLECSIDQGPYLNVTDGMVAAVGNELITHVQEFKQLQNTLTVDLDSSTKVVSDCSNKEAKTTSSPPLVDLKSSKIFTTMRQQLDRIVQQSNASFWILSYIAVLSTPLLGVALHFIFKRKFKNAMVRKLVG